MTIGLDTSRAYRKAALSRRQARRDEREAEFGRSVPAGKFGVIIAGADMATDRVSDLAAKNCVLLVRSEPAMVPGALSAIAACGFKYKTNFCQDLGAAATTDGMAKVRHILWLLATKGHVPAPAPGTQWASCIKSDDALRINVFAQVFFPSVPTIDLREKVRHIA